MLYRDINGKIIEIKRIDYLTDKEYYAKLLSLKILSKYYIRCL